MSRKFVGWVGILFAFLSKWKWYIINDDSYFWFDLISYRNGDVKSAVLGGPSSKSKASLWWRVLRAIENSFDNASYSNWFSSSISSKLGNGKIVDFWRNQWCGSSSFDVPFSSLYRLCNSAYLKVVYAWSWFNDSWVWNIGLNGMVLSCDDALPLEELLAIFQGVKPTPLEEDHFVW